MKIKKIIVPFLLISSTVFANIQVSSIKKEKAAKDYSYEITIPRLKFNGKQMTEINKYFSNEAAVVMDRTVSDGTELREAGSIAKAETVMNFKKYSSNFGITSIVTNCYFYSGGANGSTVLNSYNFDNATGQILKFDDIFIERVKPLFEKGILQIVKNNNSGKYFSNIENINLDDAVMYFDGDYIIFKFQRYTISPGASGNPAFRYQKDVVKNLIKYNFNF